MIPRKVACVNRTRWKIDRPSRFEMEQSRENSVNADAVQGAATPSARYGIKREARGKDQTAGSSRACVPLGKDLFLAEKVGTRSTQVQPRVPWKACVTMLVRACGIRDVT